MNPVLVDLVPHASRRPRARSHTAALLLLGAMLAASTACNRSAPPEAPATVDVGSLPGHGYVREDDSPKDGRRLLRAEVYLRSLVRLFGASDPQDLLRRARTVDDTISNEWDTYLSALPLPSYEFDTPRARESNALMQADYERLGELLCTYAASTELHAAAPMGARRVFAFDPPAGAGAIDAATFAPRFDVLHRLFLAYPAALAPASRAARYLDLYNQVVAAHADPDGGPRSSLAPGEAGWAAVCSALIRHPEFQLY